MANKILLLQNVTIMTAIFVIACFAMSRVVLSRQIVNNQPNPRYVTIANTGYRIQSRTLCIPDRYGIFSPGPPRLQAYEGKQFTFTLLYICLMPILNAIVLALCGRQGLFSRQYLAQASPLPMVPRVVWLWMETSSLNMFYQVIFFWYGTIYDRRRQPGYEWEDQKLAESELK